MKRKKWIFWFIFILVFFNLITSCKSIKVRTYELDTDVIKENSYITIVLISDLHNTIHGENQIKLVNRIIDHKPDLIFLTGDIFCHNVALPQRSFQHTGTELLLSAIKDLAPVFFVTGNHEYGSYNFQNITEILLSYNVKILSDNYVKVDVGNNEIIIAGLNDPYKEFYITSEYNQIEIMENVFKELDDIELYKILLAHRPERIDIYKNYSFNLILSGHAHGGQVRLPFINGLYAPNQGIFPKYAGGMYKHGDIIHIVSRGLSVDRRRPRIFNPPELVVIIIESKR